MPSAPKNCCGRRCQQEWIELKGEKDVLAPPATGTDAGLLRFATVQSLPGYHVNPDARGGHGAVGPFHRRILAALPLLVCAAKVTVELGRVGDGSHGDGGRLVGLAGSAEDDGLVAE